MGSFRPLRARLLRALRVIAPLALLSLAGCGEAALRSVSTGYVGCPSDEITISNDDIGWVQRSWDASCRGRVFHCSGAGGNRYGSPAIACAEDHSADPPAPSTAPVPIVAPLVPVASSDRGQHTHRWREVSPPECGVTALMPAAPIEEHRQEKTIAGPIDVYVVQARTPDAAAALTCFAIPGTTAVHVPKAFDRARDELLQGMQATLGAEKDSTIEDAPARDVTFAFKDQKHGRARLLFVDRTVSIAILAPLEGFTDAEARAFFASLAPARDDD